jgi:hypothetical protein
MKNNRPISKEQEGNSPVRFHSDTPCKSVLLKGSWDNWKGNPMRSNGDGTFQLREKLAAGTWEYGFECDNSSWQIDISKPVKSSPYNSKNNVLSIEG